MRTLFFAIILSFSSALWAQKSYFEYKIPSGKGYLAEGVERMVCLYPQGRHLFEYQNGFLKREVYSEGRWKSETFYDYELSDSLWVIKSKSWNEHKGVDDIKIEKWYFTDGQCDSTVYEYPDGRSSVFSYVDIPKDSVNGMRIVYDSLYSVNDTLFFERKFEEGGRSCSLLRKELYRGKNLVYHSQETLYDGKENDLFGALVGSPVWSRERPDKQVQKYSNFDKHGNWRKCYYLTEKGRVLNCKRSFRYAKKKTK